MNKHRISTTSSLRRGESVLPVVVAIALFAIVLGTIGYWRFAESTARPDAVAVIDPVANVETATTNKEALAEAPTRKSNQEILVDDDVDTADTPNEKQPDSVIQVTHSEKTTLKSQVQAHLVAGEFGRAMQLAEQASEKTQRAILFHMIADAQMDAGEYHVAFSAIRRISETDEQSQARSRQVQEQTLAGGGSGADFQPLMDLIMGTTTGPWEEITGAGGTMAPFETGVRVDPNGLLHLLTKVEQSNRLQLLNIRARKADLNSDMAKTSALRLVSLTRLEREIARRQAAGEPVLATMKQLAGLSRIQFLFIDAETNEVIIGGPAEAWQYNADGIPVGVESGRPTLQLDDFVTVLRTFSPGGNGAFQCLIVPRKENIKQVQDYVNQSQSRGSLSAGSGVRSFVKQIQKRLGEQDVVYNGVPLNSRVARVILDADYKMKLIGINKLEEGNIASYFDLLPKELQKNGPTNVALRWWLTMKYDSVLHSTNHDVFEIQGSSVLCRSENEFITAQGERVHTGKSEPTNRAFADDFTRKYAQLAQADLTFADLQNIFDLSLVAALLNREHLEQRLQWSQGVFAANGGYQPAEFAEVKTVPSAANHRVYNGRDIVVQAAGGVRGDLNAVLKDTKVYRKGIRTGNLASKGKAPQLPAGRWWWDAVSK